MHPELDNRSPYELATPVLLGPEGAPQLVVVLKASFDLNTVHHQNSIPKLAETQIPVELEGQYHGEPGLASLRLEPETAPVKPGTDVVLLGHAQSERGAVPQLDVGLRIGNAQKIARVFGDRYWVPTGMGVHLQGPKPFERLPLTYEHAFGGRDARGGERAFEARNPVGTGYIAPGQILEAPLRLPNIEDPNQPLLKPGETPPPMGFGFIMPNWLPRQAFAGTYDENWKAQRSPLLPEDFSPRFWNAASPGLVLPHRLQGQESIVVANAAANPRLSFSLPSCRPPSVEVFWRQGGSTELMAAMDTVIIDTDNMRLFLLWRTHTRLPQRGIHAVSAIRIGDAS